MAKRYLEIDSSNTSAIYEEINILAAKVGDLANLNTDSDSDMVVGINASIADVDSNAVSITNATTLIDSADSDLRRLQALIDSADSDFTRLQALIDSADAKVSTQQSLLDNAESDANSLKELFRGITGFTGQDSTVATGNYQIATASQVGGGPLIVTYTNLIPGIDSNGDLVTDLDRFYDAGTGANDILRLNDAGKVPYTLTKRRRRPDAIFEDMRTNQGVNRDVRAGNATNDVWMDRLLDDKAYDPDNLVTLTNVQKGYITLGGFGSPIIRDATRISFATDGWLEWSCPAYYVNQHQTRLLLEEDSSVVAYGTSEGTDPDEDGVVTRSFGFAEVEAGKNYFIQHKFAQDKFSSNGQGWARSWENDQKIIFAQAQFWRT